MDVSVCPDAVSLLPQRDVRTGIIDFQWPHRVVVRRPSFLVSLFFRFPVFRFAFVGAGLGLCHPSRLVLILIDFDAITCGHINVSP